VANLAIKAIDDSALEDVGQFLHHNLNPRISPDAWARSLKHPWCDSRPNFGFQLRDGDTLAGVFCAIYSDRTLNGATERFCNPHSWCVLPDYRGHSLGLAVALLRQRDYHFTMLTPNPNVAEIFLRLGFKRMNERAVIVPHLPSAAAAVAAHVAESDPDLIGAHLSGVARRDFDAHREIPWLRFLAFGKGDDVCLIVYKTSRWKRLPCALVLHVSDPMAFDRHMHLMQHHLLLRRGLLVSRVESRFLAREPRIAY